MPKGDPGAIDVARRHHLPMRRIRPRHISEVRQAGDLVITVCDLAREELGQQAAVHWSVPDPVPNGDPGIFDTSTGRPGRPCHTPDTAPRSSALNVIVATLHRAVAYRPGSLSEVLTEHYRRAHPGALAILPR